ncbi:MAG: hypothetical protein ABJL72_14395 [Roseobacter sp.]
MTIEKNRNSNDKNRSNNDIDRVDELFRTADQACEPVPHADPEARQDRDWAKKRLTYLTEFNAGVLSPISLDSPHAWIDHVLSDVSHYAKDENLLLVGECIELVQLRIREILNSPS